MNQNLISQLEEALSEVPIIDIHTHLVGGKLGAHGLHDVLLYHMVISDLYAAGCPSGNRLTEFPHWPSEKEAHSRIQEALPFLQQIQNTSSFWMVKMILQGLYNWNEPITHANWRKLDSVIRERADDRLWHHSILDRLNICRTGTEIARRGSGEDDDRLQYALEWGFFSRCQWGEFDTALYELERCWGKLPGSPSPIGGGKRPATERTIRTIEDVQAAVAHYIQSIPYDQVIASATHISTDIDYRWISNREMEEALLRREKAGPQERDIYASYVTEAILDGLEKKGEKLVFQFSFGAEPLPFETVSRLSQNAITKVAELIARHPKVHFQCFLSSRHANQSLCTMARELPNLSMAGYWWHNMFPDTMRQMMHERLDMLPTNKQVGFFSDAYCVEWTYGKAMLAKKQLAIVLAQKVEQGQYAFDQAISIARAILFESPQLLLGMVPRNATAKCEGTQS